VQKKMKSHPVCPEEDLNKGEKGGRRGKSGSISAGGSGTGLGKHERKGCKEVASH